MHAALSHDDLPPRLSACGICKSFGGIAALRDVQLRILPGEFHALMGENGAGKSTLARILAGILRPDRGTLRLDGRPLTSQSAARARAAGIGLAHQELALCPDLSIAENLLLGRMPSRAGLVDFRTLASRAESLLAELGARLDVRCPLRRLSPAQEQLVQIAAAASVASRLLILDEPTSSLSHVESEALFAWMDRLRKSGVAILYVSHRMPEVLRLAERITVLRDGAVAGVLDRSETDERRLIELMIGRAPTPRTSVNPIVPTGATPRLSVRGVSSPGRLANISLELFGGEIVGVAGLVGAGRSELARAIFGLDRAARGEIRVDGRRIRRPSPRAMLGEGVGLAPEDRKRQGLVPGMTCLSNASLASLDRLQRWGFLRRRRERAEALAMLQQLRVRMAWPHAPVQSLSGGNQQKVVLAKWLMRDLRVLIVDEPTRGVDVGTKAAIHDLLRDLAAGGVAILLLTSDMPELLQLSHRVLVMREGRVIDELDAVAATPERVLRSMSGFDVAVRAT